MNQMNSTGIYKKYKTNSNEHIPNLQWESYSKNKQNQSTHRRKQDVQDDGQWIGSQSTPPRPQELQNSYINQSFEKKQQNFSNTPKSFLSNQAQSKTPTQLIQSILKGLANNGKLTTINPYYSEQTQQKLTQILTNPNKLESFIAELEAEMGQADESVIKNYQMLTILLKHIKKSDVQIKHSSNGLELNFNRNIIMKQQNQIQRLQKKVKQKDQHIKQIIEEYQLIIRNFNDVIQKLLEQKINFEHSRYQNNGHPHHNYGRKSNR